MKRRDFLGILSTYSLTALLPMQLQAESILHTRFSMSGLEKQIEDALKASKIKKLRILVPNGCQANLKAIIQKFESTTNVAVELRSVAVDDISTIITNETLAGNQSFDVALPATFALPDLIEVGALKDLSSFQKRYEPADFRNTDLLYTQGDSYKGNFYGYQADGDCYLMFYNKDILDTPKYKKKFEDNYGYAFDVPTSWQQLDDMIIFVHSLKNEWLGGSLFRTADYMVWEWWLRFHAYGGMPFSDTLEPQIAGAEGVTALEDLVAISPYLDPRTKTDGLFDNWKSFAEGKSFCNIGWGGTQKYLTGPNSKIADKLRYGKTPGVSYFNWGWNYVVGANSKTPEEAALFALYASTPLNSTLAVRERDGYFDPFRSAHYEDEKVKEIYTDEFLKVHRESLDSAIPDLYLQGRGHYWSVLKKVIQYCDQGKFTASKALEVISKKWNEISKEIGRDSLLEQWHYLKKSYPL